MEYNSQQIFIKIYDKNKILKTFIYTSTNFFKIRVLHNPIKTQDIKNVKYLILKINRNTLKINRKKKIKKF